MANHIEILEAALSALDEAVIVLDSESKVIFWNPAATETAGYVSAGMVNRPLPEDFYQLDLKHHGPPEAEPQLLERSPQERPVLVNLSHQLGHVLPAMMHCTPLRDSVGCRFGTLLRFHTVEEIDTLLHGNVEDDPFAEHRMEQSQKGIEDRLDEASREWSVNSVPFGLMWILVDQAADLRKTHGRDAAESMMTIVEKTILHGLRPTEILGRWGSNEFLVLSHERRPARVRSAL